MEIKDLAKNIINMQLKPDGGFIKIRNGQDRSLIRLPRSRLNYEDSVWSRGECWKPG